MWYPKKKQILYAPMLSSFGGGSSRGFNPGGGGGGSGMAVLGAVGSGGSTFTNSGFTFYKANNNTNDRGTFTIPVTTAGYIYVAGIGASGGGGYQTFTISGNGQSAGGIGVGKVLVPDGTTTLYIEAGQGGQNLGRNIAGASGGALFGGNTGYSISGAQTQYAETNGSGGGLTGVFTTDVTDGSISIGTKHSSALAVLGAGGGNGSSGSEDSTGLGHGGGFNQSGLDYNNVGHAGKGASTSAGGAKASSKQYITDAEFAANPPTDGSQLTGGNGSGSDYDLGGGGGAGYYGGGGAADGGGYNASGGGGGSGYLDLTGGTAEVYHASTSYLNTMSTLSTAINNQFSTSLNLTGDYGKSRGTTFGANNNGYSGYLLVWTE